MKATGGCKNLSIIIRNYPIVVFNKLVIISDLLMFDSYTGSTQSS